MTNHRHIINGNNIEFGQGDIVLPVLENLPAGDGTEVHKRNQALRSDRTGSRRFGLLPFPNVAASMRELSFILDECRMDGVCIVPFASGRCLDETEFAPLLAEIERRGATLLIHPSIESAEPLADMRALDSMLAFARLLYYGSMDSMGNTRIILAHTAGIEHFLAEHIGILYYLQAKRWKMGRFMVDYAIRKRVRGFEMVRNIETTE